MRISAYVSCLFLLAGLSVAQDTNFRPGPQYLDTFPPGTYLAPIATPSLTFPAMKSSAEVAAEEQTMGVQTSAPLPEIDYVPGLSGVYWGVPAESTYYDQAPPEEVSASGPHNLLPQGFMDLGVWKVTSQRALQLQGYGLSLVQASRYWKAHEPAITPLYTNADIAKLPKK
jgi:hypothetical protein